MDSSTRSLRRSLRSARPRRDGRTQAIAALALVAASFLLQPPLLATAALVLAALLAGAGILQQRRVRARVEDPEMGKRRAQAQAAAISTLIAHDMDPAYLTDAEGQIVLANPSADARFGELSDTHLTAAFDSILAHPEAVLFRLQSRVNVYGAAKEDIETRQGRIRLSVVQINDDAHLWRVDESGEIGKTARAADTLALPMMNVGNSDTVLYANEAMRSLIGRRPRSLQGLVSPLPIRNGQIHRIETEAGPQEAILAVVEGAAGRKEIFAIPAPEGGAAAPSRRPVPGGWDAIEDLPVPLLKVAADSTVLASNREARQLLGRERTDGQKLGDFVDGLGRPVADWLREAMSGQGGHVSQFLRARGDAQETFVQVTLNLAEGPDGPHLIAVLNDVTELKTLEAQFVQSQKMQAIGQLAGGVAHDFNNLLTAISGHCDLLLLRHDEGDQNYGDLVQIHQNANRAASLVGQLLAFSRKQNLQPQRIDLRESLSDLTHLLNRLVGEKVALELDHDPDLAHIKADKRQLEQVMMNLVVNARDAMPQGGAIRVSTENATLDEPLQRDRATVPAGDYVVVRVRDEGIGIPPDKLRSIFEPFFTTKRQGEGTGLGLSTVYGIVKQTGGFVFAQSEEGEGTEFTLYFPAYDLPVADPLPAVIEKDMSGPVHGEGVVLLVEDEAPVRAFASRALRLRGYTVLEADSAETALDLLDDPELAVDIFVTDVIMPGMDGPTWVREALTHRPDTKVVFVSGYAEDAFDDGKEAIPNSVFLPKPFSLNQLTATVHGQLH